jgi:alginate O-acetyltransferase complex protein AlgI
MAIGLGRMFGFRFPENFRWPYIADSVQEFWRRWHISLSSWFRDYLYVPLGGSRVAPWKTYRNLVTVFFLCGLWHGASWNFVIWGLFHGTFLVLERIGLGSLLKRAAPSARHVYLLLVVMIGWVFFRAPDLPTAITYLAAMFGFSDAPMPAVRLTWYLTPEVRLALLAGIVGSMPVVPVLRTLSERASGYWQGWATEAAATVALVAVFLAALLQVAARSYNPYIYFRF